MVLNKWGGGAEGGVAGPPSGGSDEGEDEMGGLYRHYLASLYLPVPLVLPPSICLSIPVHLSSVLHQLFTRSRLIFHGVLDSLPPYLMLSSVFISVFAAPPLALPPSPRMYNNCVLTQIFGVWKMWLWPPIMTSRPVSCPCSHLYPQPAECQWVMASCLHVCAVFFCARLFLGKWMGEAFGAMACWDRRRLHQSASH